jgi:hypothetical protein
MPKNLLYNANPPLTIQQIQDTYLRKNFENLQTYFNDENQLLGFRFFEYIFTKAENNFKFKHGLKTPPKDIIVTQITGPGTMSFNVGLCDTTFADISVTGPCRVRFFLGTHWKTEGGETNARSDVMQFAAIPSGVSGASSSASSSSQEYSENGLYNIGIKASCTSNALNITLTQRDGNAPTSVSPCRITLRNLIATVGQPAELSVGATRTLRVSSGSTLGSSNGVANTIYVYLINTDTSAGLKLAVSATVLDEGTLQTTVAEGGAGGADSATVLYSDAVYTLKPIRLIGRIISTQATAGTWATQPSEIGIFPFNVVPTIPTIPNNTGGTWTPVAGWQVGIPGASIKQIYTGIYTRAGNDITCEGITYFRNDGATVRTSWTIPVTSAAAITNISGKMWRANASGEAAANVSYLNAISDGFGSTTSRIEWSGTGLTLPASDSFWHYFFRYTMS